jgi:hypothetical protein
MRITIGEWLMVKEKVQVRMPVYKRETGVVKSHRELLGYAWENDDGTITTEDAKTGNRMKLWLK